MSSNPFSRYFEGLKVDSTPRSAQEWAMLAPEERLGTFFLANVEDEHLLNAFRLLKLKFQTTLNALKLVPSLTALNLLT